MDPFTAALTAFTAAMRLQQTLVEGMDVATRAEYGKLILADAQRWHDFFERWHDFFAQFQPKGAP